MRVCSSHICTAGSLSPPHTCIIAPKGHWANPCHTQGACILKQRKEQMLYSFITLTQQGEEARREMPVYSRLASACHLNSPCKVTPTSSPRKRKSLLNHGPSSNLHRTISSWENLLFALRVTSSLTKSLIEVQGSSACQQASMWGRRAETYMVLEGERLISCKPSRPLLLPRSPRHPQRCFS